MGFLDTMLEPESGGTSVGYHAKIDLQFGYSFFASGVSAADVFVPFTPGDEESKKKAKEAAQRAAAEHGQNASKGILLVIPAETVKVRTLKTDLKKVTLQWNVKSYAKWMEMLKALNVAATGRMWAHVASMPDPDGKKQKQTRDGVEVETPQTFWYVDAIYPNEAACEAAAKAVAVAEAAGVDGGSGEVPPEGYTAKDWASYKSQIITECGTFAPPAVKKVSESYSIPVEYLMQFKPK